MVTLVNRAKMSTSTTGTGTITLGSAETGYQSFADAGVADGDVVRYVIEDGDDWEIGSGTYTATGTTLTRTVDESSNADAALNLTGSAVVFITAAAGDVFQGELFAESYNGTSTKPSATGTNAVAIGSNSTSSGSSSVAIGVSATATNSNAVSMGAGADATGFRAVSIGYNPTASSNYALALGATSSGQGANAVTGAGAISLGSYASGTASFAAGVNNNTSTYGATGANSVAIGQFSKATAANSIAIGDTATSTTANQIALGGTTDTVKISGAYTLPTSDGTSGQVLTTDGSGAVAFADAGGGGASLELYAENPSSPTAPSATGTNAVAIGNTTTASGNESITAGPFSSATAYGASAFGTLAVAAGSYSVALGKSRSGGTTSLAAIIDNNSSTYGATGANSIAIGFRAKASLSHGFACGYQNIASGFYSVALGRNTTAAGAQGFSAGYLSEAAAENSIALGFRSKTNVKGQFAVTSGYFGGAGDAQTSIYTFRSDTTDATPEALTADNAAASTTNQLILPNNSAYAFHGTIVARQQASGGTASAAWKVEGLIRREGSAGTTVLVNSATTVLDNTPSWGMALSADTTNGGLKIEATGAASTNIRWVATIHTSEVTYA